jgi:hypothetical protein
MRTVVAGLVALGLAIAVFLVWPRGSDDEEPETVSATTTTTTTEAVSTTSTMVTTTEASHVVETVAEAEEILRELWFGWFEGIYNQDEDRIREVVANPDLVEAAVAQFGVMEFEKPPSTHLIGLDEVEILRADDECLSVWSVVTGEFRSGSIEGVHVLRWNGESWLLVNTWALKEDLWQDDCDAVLS